MGTDMGEELARFLNAPGHIIYCLPYNFDDIEEVLHAVFH